MLGVWYLTLTFYVIKRTLNQTVEITSNKKELSIQ